MVVPVASLGRVLGGALAALALVATLPAGALAAGGGCSDPPSAQTFMPWGDSAWYVPAPDGGFEAGASEWALSGGAAVQDGNETFNVGSADDARSLSLPAGAAATTPPICISIAHPTIRLFVRNTGAATSRLAVSVRFRGLLGLPVSLPLGTVTGDSEWSPSDAVPVLVNLLSLIRDPDVTFRFEPADADGEWAIDDVYVDPYSKG